MTRALLVLVALAQGEESRRGTARAEPGRPKSFPHRIWAACDFEARTPDYAWFGPPETKNIPAYPGNATALGASEKPCRGFSALMTGINPVPGPCMGKVNSMDARYSLRGATEATFQHFSLSSNDNNHIRATAFATGRKVDDLFFFVDDAAELHVDEVVLYDAARL